ncbi:MAG TPA: L-serine ammonia-lyase [Gammaproteobacteria bacterium]|nr:L-serine ammonia-lyase [Gammaproteobacteria bacterium]HIK71058.1 L-serine ammonia-lyase [Pseudomonadales bacterium]
MATSIFELFKIGIGPSSSHTIGPMKAAATFAGLLGSEHSSVSLGRIVTELYGSLAATGKGHGTHRAVMLGLRGEAPDTLDPVNVEGFIEQIRTSQEICLQGFDPIAFVEQRDILFRKKKSLPGHPNGMVMSAFDRNGALIISKTYYSVGGGFVVEQTDLDVIRIVPEASLIRYPFENAEQLLDLCEQTGLSVSQLMLANEAVWRSEQATLSGLAKIWRAMQDCVSSGCRADGLLPGRLGVQRRAPALYKHLISVEHKPDALAAMDWINLYALAVNEENAGGGRVVTAPTNGAAGIIPAVAHYYCRFVKGADDTEIDRFLLVAGAIGLLYKKNASLSGAEVGCQGEVGVACSMAAGALTELLGGTPRQVENAAEIGMEHNLGLTCDPVGGLVQIPCIERNAMGAVKAVNAARMALLGDGHHYVSLDRVIKTMHQTGKDMKTKYKETSRGGLAVNVVEC